MAIISKGKIIPCPRCQYDMEFLHISEGTEYDENWAYVFYYCCICIRTLMISRRQDLIIDKKNRI